MMYFSRLIAAVAGFFIMFSVGAAHAAGGPELLGAFGLWKASRLMEGEHAVCYMSLTMKPSPEKAKPKRGDIVLMITHRPADNSTDVVSYTAGVKFKPASEAVITAGNKTFNLFTQGDTAWSRDAVTDHALATAIRNTASLSVTGVSSGNAAIADTLNTKGAFASYAAISKACGLPVPKAPKALISPKAKAGSKTPAKTPKKKQP